jgi:hydrogenase nickel incorporation protein HypA/HybF
MHELSLCQSVVDTIAERTAGARVTEVRLVVGRLSGVLPDSLRFCFGVVTAGTALQGASLDIDQPSGRLSCASCGCEHDTDDPILLCPCGSAEVTVLRGNELLIRSVEVL